VPRINPISKQDRDVAARVKEFRRGCKCTRAYLAAQIGVAGAAITRIELGRVPLRYELARQIFSILKINPLWAAIGKGEPNDYTPLPTSLELNVPENTAFSDVFATRLSKTFLNEKADSESQIALRHQRGKLAAKLIERHFVDVPDGKVGDFERAVDRFIIGWFSGNRENDPTRKLQRRIWYKELATSIQARMDAEKENANASRLTDTATYGNLTKVKAQLPSLLGRLNRATKESGKMSALADFLGKGTGHKVPLASVSRWLSGKREPGGEITLKLLNWVELQERQK
jgi:transcriptional regulator with XRE-family HTH domain